MRKSFRSIATVAVVATALAGISSVYAQQQTAPEGMPSSEMQGGMMGMMQQMSEMMSNCNRMMQTMQEKEVRPSPAPPKQERRG